MAHANGRREPARTRRRILFFGEPATLAHVARPSVLASSLDPEVYAVAFVTGADYASIPAEVGLIVREIECIGSAAYLRAVASGRPVFPLDVLERYVQDDLREIERFAPDLVVGDFRLSLAVSARLAGVPYVAISNAYWSPHVRVAFDVPVHPVTRLLGPATVNPLFRLLCPAILAFHALPMHRLRKRYGLPSLGFDLRRIFSEGDVTLLADVPELVPFAEHVESARYVYIGPIVWSPLAPLPAELLHLNEPKDLVYIAMGSSGDPRVLSDLVEGALSTGCRVAVATSGVDLPASPRLVTARFLPGNEVSALASLVVCNGGSPSTHQALRAGKPVLGIPGNLDQLLNMQFVTASGAGAQLRADRVSQRRAGDLISAMLGERSFTQRAQEVAASFQAYSSVDRFKTVIQSLLAEGADTAPRSGV